LPGWRPSTAFVWLSRLKTKKPTTRARNRSSGTSISRKCARLRRIRTDIPRSRPSPFGSGAPFSLNREPPFGRGACITLDRGRPFGRDASVTLNGGPPFGSGACMTLNRGPPPARGASLSLIHETLRERDVRFPLIHGRLHEKDAPLALIHGPLRGGGQRKEQPSPRGARSPAGVGSVLASGAQRPIGHRPKILDRPPWVNVLALRLKAHSHLSRLGGRSLRISFGFAVTRNWSSSRHRASASRGTAKCDLLRRPSSRCPSSPLASAIPKRCVRPPRPPARG
jgi:hypothetical protein